MGPTLALLITTFYCAHVFAGTPLSYWWKFPLQLVLHFFFLQHLIQWFSQANYDNFFPTPFFWHRVCFNTTLSKASSTNCCATTWNEANSSLHICSLLITYYNTCKIMIFSFSSWPTWLLEQARNINLEIVTIFAAHQSS